MDRSSTNEESLHTHDLASHQGQKPDPVQETGTQAPPPPAQQIRHELAGSGPTDTNPADTQSVSSNRTRFHLSEDCYAQASDSHVPGPVTCSLDHFQHDATGEAAHQAPSPTLSAHTPTTENDISAEVEQLSSYSDMVSSNATQQYLPPLQISESLGFEGCAGIFGGFVGILGVLGFLTFLWFGTGSAPEAADATWLWRQLALRNWMPRAITLSSIILRFIVTMQATICTSMVAALLLERLAVPRSQVARASVMRGINDGPLKLLMLMLSYKRKMSHILCHPEAWLIFLVALATLALQFSSTILLSDMHSFVMIGDLNTTTVNSLFAYPEGQNMALFQAGIITGAPVYPLFGEVRTSHNSNPDERGFSDTGLTQRGFLPMPDSNTRMSIREYDGMGMTMSSRVACMRPVITDASLYHDYVNFGQLQGVLDYGQSLQEARPGTGRLCNSSENCAQVAFSCTIPAVTTIMSESAAGCCAIDAVGGSYEDMDQPMWDPASGPWSENSSVWLVYSTTMGREDWKSLPPGSSMLSNQEPDDSEWTIYETIPGSFIKVAVCFSAFNFAYRDIHMKAAGATTERPTRWSLVADDLSYLNDTEAYLGLDLSGQGIADRLDLQIKPDNGTSSNTSYTAPPTLDELMKLPKDEITPSAMTVDTLQVELNFELSDGNGGNATFAVCTHCLIEATTVHLGYQILFSNILLGNSSRAGRAADALHAFINLAGFNVYDQFLAGTMDVAEQVRVVTTRVVTVPGSWPSSASNCAGFIAVASLLTAYVALVSGITVLYVRRTRYSRYGNLWHVVSQLVASEELEKTLELGNNESDNAVMEGLRKKESNQEDVLVRLEKIDGETIKVKRLGTK